MKYVSWAALTIAAFGSQAQAQADRTVLPIPAPAFSGMVAESIADSLPAPLSQVSAPKGAPNVFLFMSDDQGFAMSSTFGGPVPTPNLERLAATGQRYNRFQTTGICSPSRAALLTGRNHHNVGVGYLSDFPVGFPGYTGRFSPATATIAQTLRLNGYNTAMFGKHHNVPAGENSAAGPFDMWPTGLGFEYFYGFLGGSTDQWRPTLFRGTTRLPDESGPHVALDQRLADAAIGWMHDQKAAAPDKPFFIYFAPGSTHAPHQAPADYIARFRGRFDQGWDRMRNEIYARQRAAEIVPRSAQLTTRPAELPAWSSLDAQQKHFAARAMETAAGMLAYQDAQLGRVLDEMERMGTYDDTLFVIVQGDNGASAEAGPRGAANERAEMNGVDEDDAWLAGIADGLGGEEFHPNYPAGWAWAMNSPLRWTKQFASMLGGIRNGMIVSWKGHVTHPGSVCGEFTHLVDIAPTILGAAHLPEPRALLGVPQKPMDGRSLIEGLTACQAERPRTQYFEIGGKIGFYHDGWFASRDDGRLPWRLGVSREGGSPPRWELYDLRRDYSQAVDVSARQPAKLQEMVALWREVASRNNVFPILDRAPKAGRDSQGGTAGRFEFWGPTSIPGSRLTAYSGRPFVLDAEVELSRPDASGVIAAIGSHLAGWSLYLDRGRPIFVHALSGKTGDVVQIASDGPLPAGLSNIRVTFDATGLRSPAEVTLTVGALTAARGHISQSFMMTAEGGETFDIGGDTGLPVTKYPFNTSQLDGVVRRLTIDVPAKNAANGQ